VRDSLNRLINLAARRQVLGRSDCSIAFSAKVNYRGIRHRPPSKLSIGDGSIFQGQIASERDGSVVSIGKNTFIGGSQLICAERIEIGDDTLIAWGCTIVDHDSHAVNWSDRSKDVSNWYEGKKDWSKVRVRPVKIGDRVWIGFNTIILCGVAIGENAVVGCGSVVTKDVAPHTVVAGNPARFIRSTDDGN
jgi:acetyltransferase-like isoleucine patch superfamily enzyme